MITIEIQDATVSTRSFVSKLGKQLTFKSQVAYAHLGDAYPQKFQIQLPDDRAYKPGMYTISPAAFFINRYGNLEISRSFELIPA